MCTLTWLSRIIQTGRNTRNAKYNDIPIIGINVSLAYIT